MDASAQQIQLALQAVADLRQQRGADASLARASAAIKHFQARRFQATYADLLGSARYKSAARFFLYELYSDKDYADRDQQFARIASTIARLFPQAVVNTAGALAEVHALTEKLDDLMARHWLADTEETPSSTEAARYIRCWRFVADDAARQRQLDVVLELGHALNLLTRMPGLRTMLKMMRRPAGAAGLESLQKFLEAGFDAFADMRGAEEFLALIRERETKWIKLLFEDDPATCEMHLTHLLGSMN
jgi:hypothetical protein